MKRIFIILLFSFSANVFAQLTPSVTVRKNSNGIWEIKNILSKYDNKKNVWNDSIYWKELTYWARGGGDTVYHITYNSNLIFKLETGKQVFLNVFSEETLNKPVNVVIIENSSETEQSPKVKTNQSPKAKIKGFDKEHCTFNGIPLKGKVKIVNSFADFKVQIVNSFPDIKVKKVENFPDDCGEWQFVNSYPDFTIQIVTSFPDIKVKYVNSFPGI